MTNLTISQGSTVEQVSSALIDKLYNLAVQSTASDGAFTMDLSGSISAPSAYEDAVTYLTAKFPNLTITIPNNNYYIRFVDSNVQLLCVTKYSSDGSGVTRSDLQNVNSLEELFKNNHTITNLTDLRLFTNNSINVTKLGYFDESVPSGYSFKNQYHVHTYTNIIMPTSSSLSFYRNLFGNANSSGEVTINHIDWNGSTVAGALHSLYGGNIIYNSCNITWDPSLIPDQLDFIRTWHASDPGLRYEVLLFMWNKNLTKCIFPEGVTSVSETFRGCGITYIEYPSTLLRFCGFLDFRRDSNLCGISGGQGCVVFKSVTPPESYLTAVAYWVRPSAIYVPDGSVNAYKTSTGACWSNTDILALIKPMSEMTASELAAGTVTQEDIDRV